MVTPTKLWARKTSIVGIYKIVSPSGRVYIGQSWDIHNRWRLHKSTSPNGCPFMNRSFLKYGVDDHLFEIIHELPKDVSQSVLNDYEILYINLYRDAGIKLMNISDGGMNARLTDEHKKKISQANKGRRRGKPTPETLEKKRMSMLGKIPWNKGKKTGNKLTEKQKNDVRMRMIGKRYSLGSKRSLEAILITSEKNRGQKRSEETRRKISQNRGTPENVGKWNIGKKRTPEMKERYRQIQINRTDNKGEFHHLAKLDSNSVLEIRKKFNPNVYTKRMLAVEYSVTLACIKDIILKRSWRHI